MQGELDEQVPRGGTTILTVFALPGLLVGFLLWLTLERVDAAGTPDGLTAAMLGFLVFGGGTYLLTVLRERIVSAFLAAAGIGLGAGILLWTGTTGQAAAVSSGALPWLAVLGVVTVALPFLRSAFKGYRLNDYAPLYADAWNIPAIVAVAQLFVLAGAALAALVAALFAFIGLGFLKDLMEEGWFMMSYAGLLEAVGIGVVRQRENAVLAARGIIMALLRVTAPVFAVCVTVFVGAVMLRGFGNLLGSLSPLSALTAAAAVSIIMINAIVGDRGRPENALFGGTARLLGVVLLFLMSLAVYGLYLRVAAEGWTPNRIMAAVFVTLVSLYAPTYAAAALAERWVILRQGNIALSALLLLIAVFVSTPLFRPYEWTAASQVAIMRAAPEKTQATDLAYLRDRLGTAGQDAFARLAEGDGPLAERARDLPAGRAVYEAELTDRFDALLAAGTLEVVPGEAEIDEALRSHLARMLGDEAEAVLVLENETGNWLFRRPRTGYLDVIRLEKTEDGWRNIFLRTGWSQSADRTEAVMDAARAGNLMFETRSYRLPVAGGVPLIENSAGLEGYRVTVPLGEPARPAGRPNE